MVSKLAASLPDQDGSNYHTVMDNFSNSLSLLRLLKEMGIAANGTFGTSCKEKTPLKSEKEMQKSERGYYDFVTENNANITFVRWKDNKVVTEASTLQG